MGMRLLLCPISGKNDDLLLALISHRKKRRPKGI
jgi:hypothetical protein